MNTARLSALSLSALILAGCAQMGTPAGWTKIGIDENQAVYSLDPASRQQTGDVVTFRSRVDYPQAVTPPKNLDIPAYFAVATTWKMDCRARTYTVTAVDFYGKNNRLLKTSTFSDTPAQSIRRDDSAVYKQYALMCH